MLTGLRQQAYVEESRLRLEALEHRKAQIAALVDQAREAFIAARGQRSFSPVKFKTKPVHGRAEKKTLWPVLDWYAETTDLDTGRVKSSTFHFFMDDDLAMYETQPELPFLGWRKIKAHEPLGSSHAGTGPHPREEDVEVWRAIVVNLTRIAHGM